MNTLIGAELLKLRSTRLTYGLLATAVGLTVLFTVLEAARAGTRAVAPLSTAAGLTAVITGGVWALLVATVLGVTVSSGEFRHATATATYLATPRRDRVLAAKVIAAAAGGAVFGLAGWVTATGVGVAFVAADGYHVVVSDPTMARYAAGHMAAGALLAAIGTGIGSLFRSQLAAITGVFVWAVAIESIVGGLYNSVQPYLPYTAATTLAGSALGGAAFGPAHGGQRRQPAAVRDRGRAACTVAVAICAVAYRTTVGRDIT